MSMNASIVVARSVRKTYETGRLRVDALKGSELMRRLNIERGVSFLIVTHDPSVGRKADRLVRMVDGEIVEEQRLEVAEHVLAGPAA
jgi:ABC-type microcin C transport system duplicated ATPase subunit YejF